MRIVHFLLLSLMSCTAIAHPGHGTETPDIFSRFIHYVVEPSHGVVLIALMLVAGVGGLLVLKDFHEGG
jgi:hypothetical protein